MKKKVDIFLNLAVRILALMCIISCRNLINDGYPDDATVKNDFFMAVRICDAADNSYGTRADRHDSDDNDVSSDGYIFNKGLAQERAIWSGFDLFQSTPHFMIFFDIEGNKVGDALRLSRYNPSNLDETEDDYSSFTTLIAATKEDDPVCQFASGKVLVVLNANKKISDELKKADTYDKMVGILCGSDDGNSSTDFLYFSDPEDGTKYFTMSSSMIVKDGKSVPAEGVYSAGENLIWYNTEGEALQNPSYEMYVERLQVKYTVLFIKDGKKYYFGPEEDSESHAYHPVENFVYTPEDMSGTAVDSKLKYVDSYNRSESIDNRNRLTVYEADWKVNITGWDINGLEREEYLFKKIDAAANYYDGWDAMNDSKKRTFWAEDVHYTSGNYPDQFRQVEGLNDLATMTHPALDYFSYASLANKETHRYSPENTFSVEKVFGSMLPTDVNESKAYLRTGTHLVVTAQLLVDGFDDSNVYSATQFDENGLSISEDTKSAADKYLMNGIYWTENAYKEYVVEYLGYWMLSESNKGRYGSQDGKFYVMSSGAYRPATGDDFVTESVSIKGGDGYVWVRPKDGTTLYVKTGNVAESYRELRFEAGNTANYTKLAFEHQEYMAAHYAQGRMYYAIPVKHNLSRNTPASIATGDYGAVRNHWYFFEIDGVSAPGTAVDDPNQRIVPNNEPEEIGLGVNVNILDWHKIETDVDVSAQPRPGKAN